MIYLKTDEEIELMRESNLLVGMTLGEMAKWVAPGITTLKLDKIAEEFIRDHGPNPVSWDMPAIQLSLHLGQRGDCTRHSQQLRSARGRHCLDRLWRGEKRLQRRFGLYLLCRRGCSRSQATAQNHQKSLSTWALSTQWKGNV